MSPAKPEAKNSRKTASRRRLKGIFLRKQRKGPLEAALSLVASRLTAGRGQVLRDDRRGGGVAAPLRDRRSGSRGRRRVGECHARAELGRQRAGRIDRDQARVGNNRRDRVGG